jgi:hypothetical protein
MIETLSALKEISHKQSFDHKALTTKSPRLFQDVFFQVKMIQTSSAFKQTSQKHYINHKALMTKAHIFLLR